MARDYLTAINSHVVVYDGGMGATLEQFELTSEDYGGLQGKCHEALVLNRPDVIEGVHASMLDAGAEVLETDTFQGSRLKLEEWGLDEHTLEVNRRSAEIARKAAGDDRFVAGSIGPTGHLPASEANRHEWVGRSLQATRRIAFDGQDGEIGRRVAHKRAHAPHEPHPRNTARKADRQTSVKRQFGR